MTFLVSPTEPPLIRQAGTISPIAEEYGADILIPATGYFIGVQRKRFPDDFLSSLHDGRLGDSLIKLTKCQMRILLLEGDPAWNSNGYLEGHHHGVSFTFQQLVGIVLSASLELGVLTVWTKTMRETIEYLSLVESWGRKDKHQSLFVRAGMPAKEGRRYYSKRDHAIYLLQSFDGIGAEMAGRIFDHFGRAPLGLNVSEEQLAEVPGLGPKRIKNIKEALSG